MNCIEFKIISASGMINSKLDAKKLTNYLFQITRGSIQKNQDQYKYKQSQNET